MAHGWLWRLSASEWLSAATRELELAHASIDVRRRSIAHARRAAGMALNAVLVAMRERGWPERHCENVWGRSYIEHLRALSDAEEVEPLPPSIAVTAGELLAVPVMPGPGLVQLGARSHAARALALSQTIVEACTMVVGP